MEWAFAKHFSEQEPSMRFQISSLMQPNSQSQSDFVKCLSELKLVSAHQLLFISLHATWPH